MDNFNNNEYTNMIKDLIHDTKYIERSNRGKIQGLRQYAEILVRKILNLGSSIQITLGEIRNDSRNETVVTSLNLLENDFRNKLIKTVNEIRIIGNNGTHTSHTETFSNEIVEKTEDRVMELYALIFIKYFLDIRIDIYTSPIILHVFSILPPIIRYKTWKYLFKKNKNNIQVANKLCLSIIKAFSKEEAYKWLQKNMRVIKSIPYPTAKEKIKYIKTAGIQVSPTQYQVSLNFDRYNNMYDLLYDKIKDSRTSINESGKMYTNFEEAIKYYRNFKSSYNIQKYSEEIQILYSLMDFVYLGRKSDEEIQ